LRLPAGLETTANSYNAETGVYTLTIDSAGTDWALIAAQARSQGDTRFNYTVDNSDVGGEIEYQFCATPMLDKGANVYTADGGLNMLYEDFSTGNMKGGNGGIYNFCSFNNATQMVIPRDVAGYDIYIAYLAKLKNGKVEGRYAKLNLSFTDTKAQSVNINVKEEDIKPDSRVANVDVSDGYVLYHLDNSSDQSDVITTISVPSGMNTLEIITSGNTNRVDVSGKTEYAIQENFDGNATDTFRTEVKSLLWYEETRDSMQNAQAKKGQRLTIAIQKGESKIFMSYINGISPVEFEDTDIGPVRNGKPFAVPFLRKNYSDGVITVSKKDGADTTMSMDLSDTMLETLVWAPATAAKYRAAYTIMTGVYNSANREKQYEALYNELDAPSVKVKNIPEDGIVSIVDLPIFDDTERSDDPGLTIFYAESMVEGEAYICMIEWMDAKENSLGVQWFAIHIDEMSFIENGAVMSDLPTKKQSVPGIVTDIDAKLQVNMVPQISEAGNQIQYDLSLIDENGENVPLKGKTKIVLPLPESVEGLTVNHYEDKNADKAKDKFSGEGILITETALVVEVESLSPFVVSWEAADNAGGETPTDAEIGNLPATGDDSLSMSFLMATLMASLCGMFLLAKRRIN